MSRNPVQLVVGIRQVTVQALRAILFQEQSVWNKPDYICRDKSAKCCFPAFPSPQLVLLGLLHGPGCSPCATTWRHTQTALKASATQKSPPKSTEHDPQETTERPVVITATKEKPEGSLGSADVHEGVERGVTGNFPTSAADLLRSKQATTTPWEWQVEQQGNARWPQDPTTALISSNGTNWAKRRPALPKPTFSQPVPGPWTLLLILSPSPHTAFPLPSRFHGCQTACFLSPGAGLKAGSLLCCCHGGHPPRQQAGPSPSPLPCPEPGHMRAIQTLLPHMCHRHPREDLVGGGKPTPIPFGQGVITFLKATQTLVCNYCKGKAKGKGSKEGSYIKLAVS